MQVSMYPQGWRKQFYIGQAKLYIVWAKHAASQSSTS